MFISLSQLYNIRYQARLILSPTSQSSVWLPSSVLLSLRHNVYKALVQHKLLMEEIRGRQKSPLMCFWAKSGGRVPVKCQTGKLFVDSNSCLRSKPCCTFIIQGRSHLKGYFESTILSISNISLKEVLGYPGSVRSDFEKGQLMKVRFLEQRRPLSSW